ncbi:MAG: class I SAM-dependent methyltransferase [Bacteroidota bacterium]
MLTRTLEPEVMETIEDAIEYDAMDFFDVNNAFAERTIQLAPREGIILDAGTGTAQIPILIAEKNNALQIIATDFSENMLIVGRKNIAVKKLEHNIVLQKEDAKCFSFPIQHFDMIISNSLVHHIPEPLFFFKEIQRIAKPNAALFLRDLFRPDSHEEVEAIVEKYAGDCNDYQKKLYYDSLCAALTLQEVQQLIVAVGLKNVLLLQSSDRHWSLERSFKKPE